MNKIKMLYTDIDATYPMWIKSIKDNIDKVDKVEPFYKNANNADDCSYIDCINDTDEFDIVFFHANNCNAIRLIENKVSKNCPLVYFTGGGIGDAEKIALDSYQMKYLISGFNHHSPCPWFFKDFFDDWVERGGPEKTNPNFEILEKGSSQVAIDTLHKLREIVLTPLVALDLLLQTDMKSAEIEEVFKDPNGMMVDLNDHIRKSAETLRKILDEGSSVTDRSSEFEEHDLERIKKRIDNGSKNILGSLINEIEKLNAMPDLYKKRDKEGLPGIKSIADAFEVFINHIEEKSIVKPSKG